MQEALRNSGIRNPSSHPICWVSNLVPQSGLSAYWLHSGYPSPGDLWASWADGRAQGCVVMLMGFLRALLLISCVA